MIDIKIGNGELEINDISGKLLDLMSESLGVLKIIHDVIKCNNEVCAEVYRQAIKDNIELAFNDVPAWTHKKKSTSLDNQFGDVIGDLNALCDRIEKITGGKK